MIDDDCSSRADYRLVLKANNNSCFLRSVACLSLGSETFHIWWSILAEMGKYFVEINIYFLYTGQTHFNRILGVVYQTLHFLNERWAVPTLYPTWLGYYFQSGWIYVFINPSFSKLSGKCTFRYFHVFSLSWGTFSQELFISPRS